MASHRSRTVNDPFTDFYGFQVPFEEMEWTQPRGRSKDPPIENKLLCSLEELYKGTTKKLQLSRKVVHPSFMTMPIQEEEVLTIKVKPGWKKGTKITFSEKGDRRPNVVPADVVFIVDEKPHSVFTRDGDDLIIKQSISLCQALTGCIVHLTTIDGRALSIPINNVIHPNYEEVVPREGMPFQSDPTKRGNLRINFDIMFPARVNAERKLVIREVLGP